jgi:hypothetical protein
MPNSLIEHMRSEIESLSDDQQKGEMKAILQRVELSLKITEDLPLPALKEIAEYPLMIRWKWPTNDEWHKLMRILDRVRLDPDWK